jgi:hypothetical protein
MYSSAFAAKDATESIVKNRQQLDRVFEHMSDSDYRGYFAEYPYSRAFQTVSDGGEVYVGTRHFLFSSFELMRGREWEYDSSASSGCEHVSIRVPSIGLVRQLGLRWDRHAGWLDKKGELAAVWLDNEKRRGFFVRRDQVDQYLQVTKQTLWFRRFVFKRSTEEKAAQSDHFAYLVYFGKFMLIHEKIIPFGVE